MKFAGAKPFTFPGGLKKGCKGEDVKLLQELLSLKGFNLCLDGDFGSVTELALLDFQNDTPALYSKIKKYLKLKVWNVLVYSFAFAFRKLDARKTTPFEKLTLAYADRHRIIGARELKKQNLGPWVRTYMQGNEGKQWAWCAGFVCFCIKQAEETLDVNTPVPETFSCDVLAKWAQRNCLLKTNPSEIKQGAIFLIRKTANDWIHTGFVLKKVGNTIVTIEGNTNDVGSREGIEVAKRYRTLSNKIDIIELYRG